MNLGALDHVLSFSAVPVKQPKAEDKFRILMRERTSAHSGLVGLRAGSSYGERQYLVAVWLMSLCCLVCLYLLALTHARRCAAALRRNSACAARRESAALRLFRALRCYKIILKKSSSTGGLPRVELEEIGPSLDRALSDTHPCVSHRNRSPARPSLHSNPSPSAVRR